MDHVRGTVVSLFRVVVGLLFACHGAATLFGIMGGPAGGRQPELGAWPQWWAAVIELGGGSLVMLGLATRVAALVCSGTMAYAYFVVHLPKGVFPMVNGGELAALYCWAFLAVVVIGSGPWSLDTLMMRYFRARPAVAGGPDGPGEPASTRASRVRGA